MYSVPVIVKYEHILNGIIVKYEHILNGRYGITCIFIGWRYMIMLVHVHAMSKIEVEKKPQKTLYYIFFVK